jgi:hypothetical protein
MKIWQIWVAVGVVALGAAWMLRYDVRPAEPGTAFVSDRWTGATTFCAVTAGASKCYRLFP